MSSRTLPFVFVLVSTVVLMLGVLTGCGGSTTSTTPTGSATSPTAQTTTTVHASTSDASTSDATVGQEVTVWFSTGSGADCAQVSPYQRIISEGIEPIMGTLDQLVSGPTQVEVDLGASAFWSTETSEVVQSVQLTDGVLIVDFADLRALIPNASASCGSTALLAQLNHTTLQFPEVDTVRYTINGSCDMFANWLQRECEDQNIEVTSA